MTDRFILRVLEVGALRTNCYLLINRTSGEALIVDPGAEAERIKSELREAGAALCAILITHVHDDHIQAVQALRSAYPDAKLYMPEAEKVLLYREDTIFHRVPFEWTGDADFWVKDGDMLTIAGTRIRVIATPGHTAGSVCYYADEEALLFSGDTLFCRGMGRVDLPTGSAQDMKRSLGRLVREIPDETAVLPGHMEDSRMGEEKQWNPFLIHLSGAEGV